MTHPQPASEPGNAWSGQQPTADAWPGQQPANEPGSAWSGQQPTADAWSGQQPTAAPWPGQQAPAAPWTGQQPTADAWPGQHPTAGTWPSQPMGGYPVDQGYSSPGYPPPYGAPIHPWRPTNGLAVASLVVSAVALFGLCAYGLGGYIGVVGAILGHAARRQIRERGEDGDGFAVAGLIIGWLAAVVALLATIAIIVLVVWAAQAEAVPFPAPTPTF